MNLRGFLKISMVGAALLLPLASNAADPKAVDPKVMRMGEQALPSSGPDYKRPRVDRPLADGLVVTGTKNIAAAWFSEPTARYRHSPFGTDKHSATLTVSLKDRRIMRLTLPPDSVFEDRVPRLAELTRKGEDMIFAVRSYQKTGSALAIIAVRGQGLEIIAETTPLGAPGMWLNPVGAADFDGDGRPDVAIVTMPHRSGELQIWTMAADGRLEEIAREDDVSNHAVGSVHMGLAAIADFDDDGIADIAIPSRDRRSLRFLSVKKGEVVELSRIGLPVQAAEDFSVVIRNGKPVVRVGLAGGRVVLIEP